MTNVQEILDRVGSLPPLPDTALKLMSVMNDPRSGMDDIVEAVRYDQAVTSSVLKLCNSAFFGLSRKVTSLNDAMLALGTIKVLQLALSVHTNSMLTREQKGYGLVAGALWRHSVAVALASSIFSRRLKQPNASLAFTAGLLHDIGKVILSEYVGDKFADIVRRVTEEGASFTEAEHDVLGFSHEEIGGMVAENWRLPETLVRCIRYHHTPGELDPPDMMVDIVYLANTLCLLLGIGLGEDGLCSRADETVMKRYGINERDLEEVGVQMMIELQRVEALFGDSAETTPRSDPVHR